MNSKCERSSETFNHAAQRLDMISPLAARSLLAAHTDLKRVDFIADSSCALSMTSIALIMLSESFRLSLVYHSLSTRVTTSTPDLRIFLSCSPAVSMSCRETLSKDSTSRTDPDSIYPDSTAAKNSPNAPDLAFAPEKPLIPKS